MQLTHQSVTIALNEVTGASSAVINGVTVKKPSLKAIKKAIDAAKAAVFEPFTAIEDTTGWRGTVPKFKRVRVTGVKPQGRFRWDHPAYILSDGRKMAADGLLVDTPENVAAFLAAKRFGIAARKRADAAHEAHVKMLESVQELPSLTKEQP